jgi:xanthine dehydrogenase YagS FAD-binding subunit
MQAFEYASPTTLKDALAMLGSGWADAAVLAGGTDLINLMKDYLMTPRRVVNIKGIKELGGISKTATGVRIGATATVEDVASSALLRTEFPALTAAARGVTSPQIRNMGTVGGDLCQRPRCWYYRNGLGLLAMRDGRSLVENGQNEYHAIFGSGPARFVSASSFGPALIALGAKVKVASASATRDIDAKDFFVAPSSEAEREIAISPNEIVTGVEIPSARGARNTTYEVRQKEALDWPLVAASVAVRLKGTTVESARIVLGHVAPTPWVASGAEQWLAGKALNEENAAQAGKAAVADARPLSGNGYKVQLASVAVKRALLEAAKRA